MFKKIIEWYNGFYTLSDMFSNDKEYRKMVWKKYGICMGIIVSVCYAAMGICYAVDRIADKIVDKKVSAFKKKVEEDQYKEIDSLSDCDVDEYRCKLLKNEWYITYTVGSVVAIICTVTSWVVACKFCRKDN